jgi:hypothetical protein
MDNIDSYAENKVSSLQASIKFPGINLLAQLHMISLTSADFKRRAYVSSRDYVRAKIKL